MTNYLAIAGLILVTIIWGGGFVASDMALESLTPFQIMAIRFFLGTVLMGLISIKDLKGMKRKEIHKIRREIARLSRCIFYKEYIYEWIFK